MSTKVKKIRPKSSSTTSSEIKTHVNITRNEKKVLRKAGDSRVRSGSAYSAKSRVGNSDYSIDKLVDDILLGKISNIVCVVGAGISTLSGIPDFRSPGTGLYDNLKQFKIPYPEAIFDIDYFSTNPKPFFTLAKEIMPSIKYKPNKIHYFLRLLQDKNLLFRLYTQNIDGLERIAGICSDKLVEAHGTFSSAKCIGCKTVYSESFIRRAVESNQVPRCKKSDCTDIVKPNIVFFGEGLPKRFDLHNQDFSRSDLVIIMGTSLKVEPFAGVIKASHMNTPRLLINREAVGPFISCKRKTDLKILGDLSDCLDEFVAKLGWKEELEKLIITEKDRLDQEFKRIIDNNLEKNFIKELKISPQNGDRSQNASRLTEDDKTSNYNFNSNNNSNNTLTFNGIRFPLQNKVDYNAVIPPSKKISMLNDDLHRTEQLSGLYYLKDNSSLTTNEIIIKRQHYLQQLQEQRQKDNKINDENIRNKIIERNNGILGLLNKSNHENNQALLNKRKQLEDYRKINNKSNQSSGTINNVLATSKSTDALLPPNYKAYLLRRNRIQSPLVSKTMFAQDVKISNKFYANSRPLLNASILNNVNYRTPNLKNHDDDDDSSASDSSDSSDD